MVSWLHGGRADGAHAVPRASARGRHRLRPATTSTSRRASSRRGRGAPRRRGRLRRHRLALHPLRKVRGRPLDGHCTVLILNTARDAQPSHTRRSTSWAPSRMRHVRKERPGQLIPAPAVVSSRCSATGTPRAEYEMSCLSPRIVVVARACTVAERPSSIVTVTEKGTLLIGAGAGRGRACRRTT